MLYQDAELYRKWKSSQSTQDLQALVNEFEGIINKAVNKYRQGNVAPETMKLKGKSLAVEAIKSYDPSSGTSLSTWVTTYLEKLHRYYASNAVLQVSEDMFSLQHKYHSDKRVLEEELGRVATVAEMADFMGIPEKKVMNIQKISTGAYNDSSLETNKYIGSNDMDEDDLLYAFNNLSEYEQQLFTMKTGWPGGKPQTLSYITAKTGKSAATLSRELDSVANKMKLMLGV